MFASREEAFASLSSGEDGASGNEPTLPALAPTLDHTSASSAAILGTSIGPYRLLEKLGEGGFGVVYLAEQHTPFHRKVALKLLRADANSAQVLARFDAERQALALMDHPNIATVYDAGATPTGQPYLVMEFVTGSTITKFAE